MPRKTPPQLEDWPELKDQLDLINLAPKTAGEWKELTDLLKKLVEDLAEQMAESLIDEIVVGKQYIPAIDLYTDAVRNRIPAKYREFAMRLAEAADIDIESSHLPGRKEVDAALLRIRVARKALHDILWAAIDDDGSGEVVTNTQRSFQMENWILSEPEYADPLSIIVAKKIPIDRLNICSICDKVYWQKYRGNRRESETCSYECGYKLGNLKRKYKKEG